MSNVPAPASMLALPRPGPLVVVLALDLRGTAFTNIDFHDACEDRVRLHLSLRRDVRRIVANRRDASGWRREYSVPAPLSAGLHTLCIGFGPLAPGGPVAARVWLDGSACLWLDPVPRPARGTRFALRRGYPGLGRIGGLDLPANARVTAVMTPGAGGLSATDRMDAVWQGPGAPTALLLDDGTALPFIALPLPTAAGAAQALVLPGRIWDTADADGRLALTTRRADGGAGPVLTLQRHDLATRIARLARGGWLAHDMHAQLQALEHAHAAAIWPELAAQDAGMLARLARHHGLAKLAPPQPHAAATSPAISTPDDPVAALRDRVLALPPGRATPAALQVLIDGAALDPDQLAALGLALSEWACDAHDPSALYTLLRRNGAQFPPPQQGPFADSAALPYLWAAQDWRGLAGALQRLAAVRDRWLVTPALAWVLRALVTDRAGPSGRAPPWVRGDTTAQIAATLRSQADIPGNQTRCIRLLAAVAELIAHRAQLPDRHVPVILDRLVGAYALSPDFWHALRDIGPLPDPLPLWQARFRALQQPRADAPTAARWQAVVPFVRAGVAGAGALRRALVGPGGMPVTSDGTPDLHALDDAMAPQAGHEAALRWLAFPHTAPPALPERVHARAVSGLRAANAHVPRPPQADLMRALGRATLDTLAALRAGRAPDGVERLRADARLALSAGAHYSGGAVLLALAEAQARAGHAAAAADTIAMLETAWSEIDGAEAAGTTALRMAAARFAALCPDAALRERVAACLPADPALAPPADDVTCQLRAQANPLADTLVVLVSCRPYLDSRVAAVRNAIGPLLAGQSLPMVVAVGDADGGARLCGDTLELDAPDDYEGLPQKILALADWARTRTGFSRIFKLDDDCFLDPQALITDLSALCWPYSGRPLRRAPGEMDRAWHMGKARSARGQRELDKSPEPAIYAEGGAGYMLSRDALIALEGAARSPAGRALTAVSFMEDKLVGDLLAQRGITVSGENYDIAIFRRAAAGLAPLPQYENGFRPFAGAGVKLAHLDAGGDLAAARRGLDSPWPRPMKVWPPHGPARLGWGRNVLDLVSPPERVAHAQAAEVAVVAVMRNERFMLDHFLAHYRGLGVGAFLVADNGSDDGTLEHLAAQPDVAVFTTDTPYRDSRYGVLWQEALLSNFRAGQWSLIADADELAFWSLPDAAGRVPGDLPALLRQPDFAAADAVRMLMLDLYPAGPLSTADFARGPFRDADHIDRTPLCEHYSGRGPWSNAASVTSALRHRLMAATGTPAPPNLFVAQKYPLVRYRPWMQFSAGLHYISGARIAARGLAFGHFKYNAAFRAKAQEEVARGQHFNDAEEYRKYLGLLAEGRETLFDPEVSVPLADCALVRALCVGAPA